VNPVFLTVDDVLEIHRDQIRRYGGMAGIRDALLLQSAVAQPCATFEGEYLHHGLFEMPAAYLFHIVMNHPFLDGNKRTGGAAALVFLFVNGIKPAINEDAYAEMVLEVARGKMKKAAITKFLQAVTANPP
jgi:death-on-curing protein